MMKVASQPTECPTDRTEFPGTRVTRSISGTLGSLRKYYIYIYGIPTDRRLKLPIKKAPTVSSKRAAVHVCVCIVHIYII